MPRGPLPTDWAYRVQHRHRRQVEADYLTPHRRAMPAAEGSAASAASEPGRSSARVRTQVTNPWTRTRPKDEPVSSSGSQREPSTRYPTVSTVSESVVSSTPTSSSGYHGHDHGDRVSDTQDPVILRRIAQWIARVADSSESTPGEPPAPVVPIPPGRVRDVQARPMRRHNRISRQVRLSPSNSRVARLAERMAPARLPSMLWQMTTDRLMRPWLAPSDAAVWVLGTYYPGDERHAGAESASPSGSARRSEPDSNTSEAAGLSTRAALEAHVSTLVWCTYRSHFPPIVPVATEEAQGDALDAAPVSLGHLLLHPSEVLGTMSLRTWLVEQLQHDGWHVPALLAPANEPDAANATGLRTILDAIEHDVRLALRHPLTATAPLSRLVARLGTKTTLRGSLHALYDSVASAALSQGPTSDAGWGCMLRTTQSLLANALVRVRLGDTWRRPGGQGPWASVDEQAEYVRILTLFLDDATCPFGIHRLAREGARRSVPIGAWFGPSTAAAVLQAAVQASDEPLGLSASNDGMVYRDEIRTAAKDVQGVWERPVLLLIAQRLGLHEIPAAYRAAVRQTFTFPQSVGIAGGRPSSSLYFIGTRGDQLLYLDPHTVRPAVPVVENGLDAYTLELASYHTMQAQAMQMGLMDPSMLLGFLVRDAAALDDLAERVGQLPAPLFGFADTKPSYDDTDWAEGVLADT